MTGHPTPSRRRFVSALAACSVTSAFGVAYAEDISVPVDLQATLLAKVVPYDRNLPERAGDRVRTILVGRSSDPKSMPFVRQMRDALGAIGNFGSFAHDEQIVDFTNAAALLEKCRSERISVIYLGPGLRNDIEVIRDALEPISILTVSANPEDVERRIVLGFDLVFGKPKLVVHLAQARKQGVQLVAEVLKLMRVIGA